MVNAGEGFPGSAAWTVARPPSRPFRLRGTARWTIQRRPFRRPPRPRGRVACSRSPIYVFTIPILQKWALGLSHRAVAAASGSGWARSPACWRAPGPTGPGLGPDADRRRAREPALRPAGRGWPAAATRPRLRLDPRRAPQARRHLGAAPPGIPGAALRRLPQPDWADRGDARAAAGGAANLSTIRPRSPLSACA
jgi:hypothetical protein